MMGADMTTGFSAGHARGGQRVLCLAVLAAAVFSVSAVSQAEEEDEFDSAVECAAPLDVQPGTPLRCEAEIGPGAPQVAAALQWRDEDGMRVIDRIALTRAGERAPFQEIEGFDSRAFPEWEMNGFEFLDLNFDGFLDMRIVEFLPAGPYAPYLHWLWSPGEGKFVSAPSFNEAGYVEPNAEAQVLYSPWRNGAAELGEDIYVYEDGALKLTAREAERFSDDGSCTRLSYTVSGGALKLKESRPCEE